MRTNEKLWQRIVKEFKESSKGGNKNEWSARKAQMAVIEYKKRGGGYSKPKSSNNSLTKWTREKWGYVDGNQKGRYLPKYVRDKLTIEQKKRTNANKMKGEGQYVPYEKDILKLF